MKTEKSTQRRSTSPISSAHFYLTQMASFGLLRFGLFVNYDVLWASIRLIESIQQIRNANSAQPEVLILYFSLEPNFFQSKIAVIICV